MQTNPHLDSSQLTDDAQVHEPPNIIKLWVQATRAPFFTATIIPILLGSMLAWVRFDTFNVVFLLIALVAGVLLHAGTNLINDYFDHLSGADEVNRFFSPFNGGSRVIQEGLMTPSMVKKSAFLFFSVGASLGLLLEFLVGGWVIFTILVLGLFLAIFYTAAPIRTAHHGLGEFTVFVGYGPLLVLVSWFAQSHSYDLVFPLFWSVIPGILVGQILLINEFPDVDADAYADKRTMVVRLSKKTSMYFFHFNIVLVYVWLIFGSIFYWDQAILALLALASIPIALKALGNLRANYQSNTDILPTNALTVQLHLAIGVLMIFGLGLGKVFL